MTIPTNNETKEKSPERISLRAGSLTMLYEAGTLRYIRLGEHEIVRGIYAAVRDQNWGTVPAKLRDFKIDKQADSFKITFTSEHIQENIHFVWHGTIRGNADNSIQFSFDGEALSSFKRNRVGFCVLHPMDVAGMNCEIEHTDGSTEIGIFPKFIAPHQPFLNISAIRHEAAPGLVVEVRMEGDTFEMEDQRNWVDASYKTYCTPLSVPYPALLQRHVKVQQSITVQVSGISQPVVITDSNPNLEIHTDHSVHLPPIGLCVASSGKALTSAEIDLLKVLHLAHLRVDLHPADDGLTKLRQAMVEAEALGCALELAIHIGTDVEADLQRFKALIDNLRPNIARWLIFRTDEVATSRATIAAARRILAPYGAPIGSGTDAFFTQLNRSRPPADLLDWISYSINPQVHAFDDMSLIETFPAQAVTIESARQFSMDAKIAVSPVTLKMRWNPDATAPEPEPLPGMMPRRADARQMSLFGAVWTLGSIKSLMFGGADSLTYYETTGWTGIMPGAEQKQFQKQNGMITGSVYPIYHVFADIAEFAHGDVLEVTSNQPQTCDALALHREGATRILIANYTPNNQRVSLQGLEGQFALSPLDETTVDKAITAPDLFRSSPSAWLKTNDAQMELELLPYAYVRLDYQD